jgi:hypothetical protein
VIYDQVLGDDQGRMILEEDGELVSISEDEEDE